MLIAEPAADATTGIIDPKRYAAKVEKMDKEFGYKYGGATGDLARAAPLLPTPTAQGGVKSPPTKLSKKAIALVGGGGILGAEGIMHAWPAIHAALENPITMLAAGAAAVPPALGYAAHKAYQAFGNSAAYRNMLLRRAGATVPVSTGEAALRGLGTARKLVIPAATTIMNR